MSNFHSDRPYYGQGNRIQAIPQVQPVTHDDFSKGLILTDKWEKVPPGATPDSMDMMVSNENTLRRAPGTIQAVSLVGKEAARLFTHLSLDYSAELLLFDPPFMGVFRATTVEWIDIGLGADVQASVNYGGTFVFTDGERVYARQPNTSSVEVLTDAPVAATYANFAGRIFAGDVETVDGKQALGIRWSHENADHGDWPGLNYELLIDAQSSGGKIMALEPLGLDVMAIILRSAIWTARRTGILERPADFQMRTQGIGCISTRTVQGTPIGVIFLSDNAVYVFDGSQAKPISMQVESGLFPLDLDNLHLYHATYNYITQEYHLTTPADTYVYQIKYDRWYRKSMTVDSAAVFPYQVSPVAWDEVIGSWDAQNTILWSQFVPGSSDDIRMVYCGTQPDGVKSLEYESVASREYFGRQFEPYWTFVPTKDQRLDGLLSLKGVNFQYSGGGTVSLHAPNHRNVYSEIAAPILRNHATPDVASFGIRHTGLAAGLKLIYSATADIDMGMAQLLVQRRGPRVSSTIQATNVQVIDYFLAKNFVAGTGILGSLGVFTVSDPGGVLSPDALLTKFPGIYIPDTDTIGNYISIPDHPVWDNFSPDLDFIIKAEFFSRAPARQLWLLYRWREPSERSFMLRLLTTGNFGICIGENGGCSGSTDPCWCPETNGGGLPSAGEWYLRLLVDLDNAAGSTDIQLFYNDPTVFTDHKDVSNEVFTTDINSWNRIGDLMRQVQTPFQKIFTGGTAPVILGGGYPTMTGDPRSYIKYLRMSNTLYSPNAQYIIDFENPNAYDETESTVLPETVDGPSASIVRNSTGKKAIFVKQPTLLFGNGSFLELLDNTAFNFGSNEEFTVVVVARDYAVTQSDKPFIAKRNSKTEAGWSLYTTDAGALAFNVNSGAPIEAAGAAAMRTGQHNIIAGTRSASEIAAVEEGVEVDSTPAAADDLTNAVNLKLGGYASGPYRDFDVLAFGVLSGVPTVDEIVAEANKWIAENNA